MVEYRDHHALARYKMELMRQVKEGEYIILEISVSHIVLAMIPHISAAKVSEHRAVWCIPR